MAKSNGNVLQWNKQDEDLLPHDPQAERGVVGSCLLDYEAISRVADWLQPGHFHDKTLAVVYAAMLDLFHDDKPTDLTLVSDALRNQGDLDKIGGFSFLTTLVDTTLTPSFLVHYAKIVQRDARRRNVVDTGAEMVKAAHQSDDVAGVVAYAEKMLSSLDDDDSGINPHAATAIEEVEATIKRYEHLRSANTPLGPSSGIAFYDRWCDGMIPKLTHVVSGYTGTGKTFLGLNMSLALIRQEARVVFFSLEMPKEQLAIRCLALMTGIPTRMIARAMLLTPEQYECLQDAKAELRSRQLYILDHVYDTIGIGRWLRQIQPDVAFVDFAQNVVVTNNANGKRYDMQTEAARTLQNYAKKYHCTVVIFSQMANEAARLDMGIDDPVISTKDSGAWAHIADMACVLAKDKSDTRLRLVCKKNRHGRTGSGVLDVDWEVARMTDTGDGLKPRAVNPRVKEEIPFP